MCNVAVSESKARIPDEVFQLEEQLGYAIPPHKALLERVRYFSNSFAIGSKMFIQEAYAQYGERVLDKKGRSIHKTGLGGQILSVRNLAPT